MTQWLYRRLLKEDSKIKPDFSLLGTINWLNALSFLCSEGFSDQEIATFYQDKVIRRKINRKADTLAFEQMLMGFHELSALQQMSQREGNPYDLIRSAIVSWYYGIYYAGSAMIAAKDGTHQEDHAGTAKVWNTHISKEGYALLPFSLGVTTLVKSAYVDEIFNLRPGTERTLYEPVQNREQALEACLSYLKGTADWSRKKKETEIKRKEKLSDFKKKSAQQIRDRSLQKQSVGFLHQAFRYRGKAHYRDAIYLSYGNNQEQQVYELGHNLYVTLSGFVRMASHYCSKRVEKDSWAQFVEDVSTSSLLSHDVDVIRASGSANR
ncbi:MAG: hypothetical protein ACFB2W_16765 [Leptolyngbyaceae cyanobacterium]